MMDSCLLQTRELLKGLEETNVRLTNGERERFQNISQDLYAALQPPTEKEVSILSRDLITVTKFIEVVAE